MPSSPYWPVISVEAESTACSLCNTAAQTRAAELATAYSVHCLPW